jgi:hypothetical protein
VFRHVLRFFTACALITPAFFVSAVHAQSRDEEAAGHSRGGYAWGEERRDEAAGGSAHHYGRAFATLGAGGSVRIILYETLVQERLAPPYLQLRGGYFFESDGMVQHGLVLGVASTMLHDGPPNGGVGPFSQWALTPAYMVRLIPEGSVGDIFQATGRFGVPFALGDQFSWGLELGLGMLLKPWSGVGFYGEIDMSVYFAQDTHPLLSFELGLAFDMEVLP